MAALSSSPSLYPSSSALRVDSTVHSCPAALALLLCFLQSEACTGRCACDEHTRLLFSTRTSRLGAGWGWLWWSVWRMQCDIVDIEGDRGRMDERCQHGKVDEEECRRRTLSLYRLYPLLSTLFSPLQCAHRILQLALVEALALDAGLHAWP